MLSKSAVTAVVADAAVVGLRVALVVRSEDWPAVLDQLEAGQPHPQRVYRSHGQERVTYFGGGQVSLVAPRTLADRFRGQTLDVLYLTDRSQLDNALEHVAPAMATSADGRVVLLRHA